MSEIFNQGVAGSVKFTKNVKKNFISAANTFAKELSLDKPFQPAASYLGTGTDWGGMGKTLGTMGMLDKGWFGGRAAVDFMTGAKMSDVTANLGAAQSFLGATGEGSGGKTFQEIRDMDPRSRSTSQQGFLKSQKEAGVGREAGGAWDSKRIGRAVGRNVALMGGIAAADFLNPFSPGWND